MENSVDSYINAQPEQAMTYADYYEKYSGYGTADYDNIFMKLVGGLSGTNKKLEDNYKTYLSNLNNRNEFLATQSARAWDKYLDDTKVQRAMRDYAAAGLNPYLLVNSGSSVSGSAPSSAKASYGTSDSKQSGSGKGRDLALILLAVARIAAAFL